MALTLGVLGGLTTEEIARGLIVLVSTIFQRIVGVKRTLARGTRRVRAGRLADGDLAGARAPTRRSAECAAERIAG